MLIKESQLMVQNVNPISLLDEATFITESEAMVQPIAVPVREMSRFGEGATMVHFADVERLAEDNQFTYMEAMAAIAEANQIDASKMTVAVDEADLIVDPSLLDEMANVVVAPLSENSLAYRYVSECIDAWAEMDDTAEVDAMLEASLVEDADLEAFLEAETVEAEKTRNKQLHDQLTNYMAAAKSMNQNDPEYKKYQSAIAKTQKSITKSDATLKSLMGSRRNEAQAGGNMGKIKSGFNDSGVGKDDTSIKDRLGSAVGSAKSAAGGALDYAKNNKGKVAMGAAGVAGAVALGAAILKKANSKPKSWIGQKIAALRNVYAKWMKKAQNADASVGGRIKAACGKLMAIIDKLMAKLQNAAG